MYHYKKFLKSHGLLTPKLCPFPRIATVVSLDTPVTLSLVVNETIAKRRPNQAFQIQFIALSRNTTIQQLFL